MTPRQVRYYRHKGKVPVPGRRSFSSRDEARAHREEQGRLWADYDWEGWT